MVDSGNRIPIIFVLGPPGVGKHTHCARMSRGFGIINARLSDLIAAESQQGTATSAQTSDSVEISSSNTRTLDTFQISQTWPDEVAVDATLKFVESTAIGEEDWVSINGFPQSISQLKSFEAKTQSPNYTVILECPTDVLMKRNQDRYGSAFDETHLRDTLKQHETFIKQLEAHMVEIPPFTKTVSTDGDIATVFDRIAKVVAQMVGHAYANRKVLSPPDKHRVTIQEGN